MPTEMLNTKSVQVNEMETVLRMKRHSLRKIKQSKPSKETVSMNEQEGDCGSFIFVDAMMNQPAPPPGIVRRIASSINRHNRFIPTFRKEPKQRNSTCAECGKSSFSNTVLTDSVSSNENYNMLVSENETNFFVTETQNGIQIQIIQPHLISTVHECENEDKENKHNNSKTKIKIYPLKTGRTTIGSSLNNDIVLNGKGIEPEHCFIECIQTSQNESHLENNLNDTLCKEIGSDSVKNLFPKSHVNMNNLSSHQPTRACNFAILFPLAKLCSVDGVLIDRPYGLNLGFILIS
jgi:hypothetical protein